MKVNATTHDDGLRLTLTISGPEVADAFASACKDYRMRDAIMKIMFDQSAPLAQAIAEQVKIAIESPQSQASLRLALDRGLAAAITIVETGITEAARKASSSAIGKFLASTFARLRRGLDSE